MAKLELAIITQIHLRLLNLITTMKKIFSLLLFVLVHFCVNAQNANDAIIIIKVTDENNLSLPGASVQISNGKMISTTDVNGIVRFFKVQRAKYDIKISYIGYQELKGQLDVKEATQEFSFKLESGVNTLNGVVVLGDRLKGQAKALNQQKNGGNIANIISADQIGRFPDANLGDALKRVPGVTMQNDQGEARDIIIRGLAPELNSVTLNGDRIPSAEGDNRRIQMDLIPADMVQIVEVNKTVTADMEPDAIGGSVNLVTRSAPNKFRLSGTGSFGFNPIRQGALANVAMVAGGRIFNNKLGIIASMNINDNVYGSDNIEAVWARNAAGRPYLTEHDIRIYDVRRMRRSFQVTSDWKINKKNTIILNLMNNSRDDWENRYRIRMRDIAEQADGSFRGRARVETKGGIDNPRVRNARLEAQKVNSFSLKGEHIIGSSIQVSWSSTYSKASEFRPNERYLDFQTAVQAVNMDIADPERPNITFANQPALSTYGFRRLWELATDIFETDWNNKINFKLPIRLLPAEKNAILKFGARYSVKEKSRTLNYTQYNRAGIYAGSSGLLANMGQLFNLLDLTNPNFNPGVKYQAGRFVDPRYIGNLNLYNTSFFTPQDRPEEYLADNYDADEKIAGGYISLEQKFSNKLTAILGIRAEQTNVRYVGNRINGSVSEGKVVSEPDAYTNILPSINLKYELEKDFILRAAWTNTMARPRYFDLVPFINVNVSDEEIAVGNTSLKPTISSNIDLMAEKYLKSVGIISGGVFYKRLTNFFYTYRSTTYNSNNFAQEFPNQTNPIPVGSNWDYRQTRNGDLVNLYGFEIAYQRQLDFLPGFWKGFGIYLNYTFTQSRADGIFNADGEKRTGIALPGTAPHMMNASLSYENKRFIARVAANFTAAYIDELGSESFEDRFYDKQFFLDANASYAITPRLRWFGEINNITNQPLRYYQGSRERTMQLEYYQVRWNTGLKFDITK